MKGHTLGPARTAKEEHPSLRLSRQEERGRGTREEDGPRLEFSEQELRVAG